ncbi:uncharacterized protein LOC111111789 isoform X2 [Crassostrea virginica]
MMSQTTDSDEETLAIPMDVPTEPEETYSEWKKSVGCQFNYHPKHRSKYCQTSIKENHKKMVSVGTQTEFEKKIMVDAFANVTPRSSFEKPINRNILGSISSMDDPVSSPIADDSNDESYCPTDSDQSSDNYEDEPDDRLRSPQDQKKFFVFEENLMELFSRCRNCSAKTTGKVRHVIGSMIKIQQVCEVCEFTYHWQSQPVVAGKPAGNLIMSAGILFSGALPSKVLRMYKFCKIACISNSTFMNHQKYYLFPSISHVWSNFQHDYFNDVKLDGRAVVLGGDGRADTPGHSAKFGCYSVVDLDEGIVADIQLVQSNEVKSSSHMEKEGLVRCVDFFKSQDINIQTLVTDRHVQIVKWVRENMPESIHLFDVWHVAKASTSLGLEAEVVWARWTSLCNHIIDVHTEHSAVFNSCEHGPLEGRERHKMWLKPGTKVFEKLQDIINSRQLKKDIPKLSSVQQTSALEGFHSVINHFAPKMIGFSYHGMLCRLWLAALHFNENTQRTQAVTKEGKARYRIVFPKYKRGEYTVRKISVDSTYDYIQPLMNTMFGLAEMAPMDDEDGAQLPIPIPPPLCSEFDRPDKEVAVQNLRSRFSQSQGSGSLCSSGQEMRP